MKPENVSREVKPRRWTHRMGLVAASLVAFIGVGMEPVSGAEAEASAAGKSVAPEGVVVRNFNLSDEHPALLDAMLKIPGGLTPHPIITNIQAGTEFEIKWSGFAAPYEVLQRRDLASGEWESMGETDALSMNVPLEQEGSGFFRIQGRAPNFAGAEVCMICHDGKHNEWSETSHAHALETLKDIGQDQNSRCVVCHTVGYGLPTGFQDEQTTPHLAGVQCENCHGPAGEHAANPLNPDLRPVIEMASQMCGSCHGGSPHHATFDEWNLSRHSVAKTSFGGGFSRQSCLECHSQDYRYTTEHDLEQPTVETAKLSIECSTCHEPHGGVQQAHLLRQPIGQLCGSCHTSGEPALGSDPHHPQFDMLKGSVGFLADGSDLESEHSHQILTNEGGRACAQCHIVKHEVEDPTMGDPIVTGHTFNPFDESITAHQAGRYAGCAICHSTSRAEELRLAIQDEVHHRLERLVPFFDSSSPSYIDPEGLSEEDLTKLEAASFNFHLVEEDKSGGVHNPTHARNALSVAENVVEELSGQSLEPLAISQK